MESLCSSFPIAIKISEWTAEWLSGRKTRSCPWWCYRFFLKKAVLEELWWKLQKILSPEHKHKLMPWNTICCPTLSAVWVASQNHQFEITCSLIRLFKKKHKYVSFNRWTLQACILLVLIKPNTYLLNQWKLMCLEALLKPHVFSHLVSYWRDFLQFPSGSNETITNSTDFRSQHKREEPFSSSLRHTGKLEEQKRGPWWTIYGWLVSQTKVQERFHFWVINGFDC